MEWLCKIVDISKKFFVATGKEQIMRMMIAFEQTMMKAQIKVAQQPTFSQCENMTAFHCRKMLSKMSEVLSGIQSPQE